MALLGPQGGCHRRVKQWDQVPGVWATYLLMQCIGADPSHMPGNRSYRCFTAVVILLQFIVSSHIYSVTDSWVQQCFRVPCLVLTKAR